MFADLCQFSPTKQPSGVSFNSTKLSKHVRGEFNDEVFLTLFLTNNRLVSNNLAQHDTSKRNYPLVHSI